MVDINGTSGNKSQLGTDAVFSANPVNTVSYLVNLFIQVRLIAGSTWHNATQSCFERDS